MRSNNYKVSSNDDVDIFTTRSVGFQGENRLNTMASLSDRQSYFNIGRDMDARKFNSEFGYSKNA